MREADVTGRAGADLVLIGRPGAGQVWPGAGRARSDAVAVRDGVVVALGEPARELAQPGVEVLELGDGWVGPAFGDGHAHPLWGGVELDRAPVASAASLPELLALVGRYAEEHPDRAWVLGGSYDPALAPGGVFDAAWLDAVLPDRPVALTSSDHHVLWCNSAALVAAGVDARTLDPPGGQIVRRPDGSPCGTLREWSAMALVEAVMPETAPVERVAGLIAGGRKLAEAGVGWVQDAKLEPADVSVYLVAAASGQLAVRANLALLAEPGRWRDRLEEFEGARRSVASGPRDAAGDPWVSVRTVKFFADGVVEAGTAALLDPYLDRPGDTGTPVWSAAELAEAVSHFDAAGWQVHLHAIGDAGVRLALDAVQAAVERNPAWDRRPVLAHLQLVDPADRARMGRLGVIANIEPRWAHLDACQTELTLPRLGHDRGLEQYPFAALAEHGVRLSTGSDWPVSSHRPLECLSVACTRAEPGGQPSSGWVPEQRLSVEQALAAATAGVAYQALEERRWGELLPGRRADLVLLSDDPFALDPARWSDICVRARLLAGRSRPAGPRSADTGQ